MALRQALQRSRPLFQPLLGVRPFTGVPKVSERMVRLVVVDQDGLRHTVRGLEGTSLSKALKENSEIGQDAFFQQPLSAGGYDAHVTVTNNWVEKLPEITDSEKDTLWECGKDVSGNSRLASSIVLCEEMDGMTVAVGKTSPWQTL